MPGCTLAGQLDADDIRQPHPGGAAEHDVLGFQPADADGDDAERVDMRGVAIGADQRIREGDAVAGVDHRRHPLQIDLVHDAVARRHDLDVLESFLGPVDEVEAILVAAILDGAVLGERIFLKAAMLDGERVIDDQLHRHHRVHLGRIAAHIGNRIAQAGEVNQRGLAEDIVADHAGRVPGKVQLASCVRSVASKTR